MLHGVTVAVGKRLEMNGNSCNTSQHQNQPLLARIARYVIDFPMEASEGIEPPYKDLQSSA
jgi:hypothetical protein